jgi:hypothetical protein
LFEVGQLFIDLGNLTAGLGQTFAFGLDLLLDRVLLRTSRRRKFRTGRLFFSRRGRTRRLGCGAAST